MIFVVYKEKNMKKSKIIVPAIAMIAFSTAASIAGSVAWFTASRQATIDAGTYAVVKTTSELKVALSDGIGTNTSGQTVTFGGKLTDGSFNHKNNTIYTPNADGTAVDTDRVYSLASVTESNLTRATLSDSTKIYTAVYFKVTLSVNFGVGNPDVGLYLNCYNNSEANPAVVNSRYTSGSPLATAKGFRMAIVPDTNTIPSGSAAVSRVFADLQSGSNCHYISGTTLSGDAFKNGTNYEGKDLIDSAYNEVLPTTETARATAIDRNDYLGFLKAVDNTVQSVTYYVVCWFEGTDPEIKNRTSDSEYQEVHAYLTFEAVNLQPATNP